MTLKNASATLAILLCACAPADPVLNAQSSVVLGESPGLTVQGALTPNETRITAEMTDTLDRRWRIDLPICEVSSMPCDWVADEPIETVLAMDALGMLARLEMTTELADDWEPPAAKNFNDITFHLRRNAVTVSTARTRQWVMPEDSRSARIEGELVAEIFLPRAETASPGVLLLGGSGGGMDWARRTAALLAHEGLAAMAVAYFRAENLPPDLIEIPVEYVESALDALKNHAAVDSSELSIVAYSKGAELALLVASRRADVGSVVAFAPGSAVFQGFRAPDYPVLSSWSEGGQGLPFVPNAYDKVFFESFDGMYLWYRTLQQHEAFAAAALPVENINGDILLISGIDDTIWPATMMGEQIIARLSVNQFGHDVKHLAYPEAGHGIAAPPGQPLTSVARRLGGTVAGNDRARRDGWRALIVFLTRNL